MAIDTTPGRCLARQTGMRLHRATQKRLSRLRLPTTSAAHAAAARRGLAYRALGIDHGEDERAAVCGERADGLRPAVLEETRQAGLVRRGEASARPVPRELHRHLDERVWRQASYTRVRR